MFFIPAVITLPVLFILLLLIMERKMCDVERKIDDVERKIVDVNPCCVCFEHPKTILFVSDDDSCGHICGCEYCALNLYKCPLCRFEGKTVTVYL